jgi:uncharacterized protein (DUF2132 family)
VEDTPCAILFLMDIQPKNPLHGITLKAILEDLVARYGFEELGKRIKIRCFTDKPSITSSLAFLRKTPWARLKVEKLYLRRDKK